MFKLDRRKFTAAMWLQLGQYLSTLRLILIGLWPMTVLAAGQSLGQTFGEVTWQDWVTLLMVTLCSGAVALLHRVKKSYEAIALRATGQTPDPAHEQLINWKLFAACHMTGAVFMGFITFFILESFNVDSYLEAAVIALISWRGAMLADKWADSVGDKLSGLISFGSKQS